MRSFLFSFLLTLPWTLSAAIPCQPITLQGETINIQTHKPIFVLFHNTSMHNLFITHEARPAWSSLIEPDKWSLLEVIDPELHLTCIESVPGHEQFTSCQNVITLCQKPAKNVKIQETKWLSENTSQSLIPESEQLMVN